MGKNPKKERIKFHILFHFGVFFASVSIQFVANALFFTGAPITSPMHRNSSFVSKSP